MCWFAVLDSQPKTNVGVPAYTPPELLLAVRTEGAACDGRGIDVWSSGVILFFMLNGQLPFTVRSQPPAAERQPLGLASSETPQSRMCQAVLHHES